MKIITVMVLLHITLIVIIIGICFNFVVMINNQGKMPVFSQYNLDDLSHFSYQNSSQVNYSFFADKFKGFGWIASIGDIVMFLGLSAYFGLLGLLGWEFRKNRKRNI